MTDQAVDAHAARHQTHRRAISRCKSGSPALTTIPINTATLNDPDRCPHCAGEGVRVLDNGQIVKCFDCNGDGQVCNVCRQRLVACVADECYGDQPEPIVLHYHCDKCHQPEGLCFCDYGRKDGTASGETPF